MKRLPDKTTRRCARLAPGALLVTACQGPQSTLQPSGPAARAIASLSWVLFDVAALVFIIVCALLAYAVFRRRREEGEPAPLPTAPGAIERSRAGETGGVAGEAAPPPSAVRLDTADSDRASLRWVAGGVGVTAVVLIGILITTLLTLGMLENRDETPALTIEVTGWQWWWEVHYLDAAGNPLFETANEIRIPVGKRVRVRLRGGDVIHSFWVPRLAGKMDLIPGRVNELRIEADEPGVFRGQCAEYCAGPHALMAFQVVALPPGEFRHWVAHQREPGVGAADSLTAMGQRVFLTRGCAGCHSVRGTPARGEFGPDLTHVATRLTLAAGTMPTTKGHMGGWIANPQEIKPGNKMPALPLSPEELITVTNYMMSLH